MAANTDEVGRGSRRIAEVLLRKVERIAQRSATRMQESLSSYAAVPHRELVPIVLANTRNLLEAIRDPAADRSQERSDHRASGVTRARQGITTDDMLHAWRIGLEVVRDEAHGAAEELEIGAEGLLEFIEASVQWGDAGMRASASAHHEAELEIARDEFRRLVDQQAALRRVATLVAQGAPSRRVFAAVAEEVATVLRVPLVLVWRFESDGTATSYTGFPAPPELGNLLPAGKRWSLEGTEVMSRVRSTGRSARIDDYSELPGEIAATVRSAGMRSAVGVPIAVDGQLWGAAVSFSRNPEPLPVETEARMSDFTELLVTAISNANARAEVERLVEEQAALRRVATLVARERSAQEVFALVAEEVGRLLGVEVAFVHRYDPDGDVTVVGSWARAPEHAFPVGRRRKLDGDNVSALVYRTRRSVRVDNDERPLGSIAADVRRLRLRAAVGTPIFVKGGLWGAIVAATARAPQMAVGVEARTAQFTELVATAIANLEARSDLAASRARIVAAADEERRRVVRDLHDGAQQRLVHTIVTLKQARRALRPGRDPAARLVDEALRHAETATQELRELAHGILPSALTNGGLRAGILTLASRMCIPVEVEVSVGRLPGPVEATAYFIVAEALTNVAKHARAQSATVSARVAGGLLELEVSDDGIGGVRPNGTGLLGLRDRLSAVGGTFRVNSPAGGGTAIAALIPTR
jgi:signal transduction histidine kinase